MSKPNVIVFFTDQQRWDTTGVHDNPLDLTPNFDRMARRGTHLYNAFTCQPVCGPARSSFQTGMYPTQTGCFRNGIALPDSIPTLATCFQASGYDTAYIGKWHLAVTEPVEEGMRGGYQYWLASNVLEFSSEPYKTVVYNNNGEPVHLPGYRVNALTDAAIRYIAERTHKSRPFFLFLSFLEPHQQNRFDNFPAPEGYAERYNGRWTPPDLASLGGSTYQQLGGYFGMVKRLDEAFGLLLESLKSLQILDETVVFYTSDHGCHFKTRNNEYKRSCHEGSIRIPAALQGPGFNGGGQIRNLVSLVDFAPTLLNAADAPIPQTMQGRSFLPLTKGENLTWPEEVYIQISESQVGRAVRTARWKYGVTAPDHDGGRDSASPSYIEEYLYDLETDPYEITNLIMEESHRKAANVLKQRLLRRMMEAEGVTAVIESSPCHPSGQRSITEEEARM